MKSEGENQQNNLEEINYNGYKKTINLPVSPMMIYLNKYAYDIITVVKYAKFIQI